MQIRYRSKNDIIVLSALKFYLLLIFFFFLHKEYCTTNRLASLFAKRYYIIVTLYTHFLSLHYQGEVCLSKNRYASYNYEYIYKQSLQFYIA